MLTTTLIARTILLISLTSQAFASSANGDVQAFLDKWDAAWAHHDPHAIAALHAEDAVTVNRFGTIIYGRAGVEKAMTILHTHGGIFSQATFPSQQVENVHRISPDVVVVQTKWQNPSVTPDGKVHPERPDDMVVTYVLATRNSELQIVQLDLHNVVKMANPYPTSITHPQS